MTAVETELIRYRDHGDESAFAAFVTSRTDLVWSVALRKLQDRALAEEVVQSVFADVAANLRRLELNESLTGWLVKHTLLKAAGAARRERRRLHRDHRYSTMNAPDPEAATETLTSGQSAEAAELLDSMLGVLSASDRQALLLRFYEKQELPQVAARLGLSAEAVRKRISRALDLIRSRLAKRGITSSAGLLSTSLMTASVGRAPSGLAQKAASFGLTHGIAKAGLGTALQMAARRALQESRWLPALAGGAAVAMTAPVWHQPLATPTTPPPLTVVTSSSVPSPSPPSGLPASMPISPRSSARRPPGSKPVGQESLFADFSRLLDSPLGGMATNYARREFAGRWKDALHLDNRQKDSLDAWLADSFRDAITACRQALNDPTVVRLALDQAAGQKLSPEQTGKLTEALAPLNALVSHSCWTRDNLNEDQLAILRERQQQMRTNAAATEAMAAVEDLDQKVSLTAEQKEAVLAYKQSAALARKELLQEEQLGFMAAPETLPGPPAEDEPAFLQRLLTSEQWEAHGHATTREQAGLQEAIDNLRRSR